MITIRASSTTGWTDCQLRAAVHSAPKMFAEHGYDIRPPRANIGALVGSGVHGAAEPGLKEKMLGGTVMPASALADAGIEAFRARRLEEAEDERSIVMDDDSPSIDDAERQIARMTAQYREDVLRHSSPVCVESRLSAAFMEGVELSGQADLLHLDGQEANVVRDLKTGRRKLPAAKHAAQIGSYSLLFRAHGYETAGASIDYLKRTKLKVPQDPVEAQPLGLHAAESIAHSVLTDMGMKLLAFAADGEPGRFIPNPSSFLCGSRFCRAFGRPVCPATRSE